LPDTFITNSPDKRLLDRLNQLTLHSDRLSFLSGFFYFSGNRAIASALRENPSVQIRILVGLEADSINGAIAEYAKRPTSASRNQELSHYIKNLTSALQNEAFDEAEFYEQAIFFLDLMDSGRLEIRKTESPNHAKLYLFELNSSQIGKNKLFITGSSNLTRFGLSDQREFNVEIADFGFDTAKDYFEECWDNAIPLTQTPAEKYQIRTALLNSTPLREVSPSEAYLAAIDAYLDSIGYFEEPIEGIENVIKKAGYKPLAYQIDAVRQALGIFQKFGGVVIADVVGLGKSIVGSALASVIGKRGLLLAPPGLLGDDKRDSGWRKYLEDFGLHDWIPLSTGALDSAENLAERFADIEVVMIDEAHRFRNENTKSYETLLKICRGKKVILLTATPFNNSPSDILSLLQLFIKPKDSGLVLDRNVKQAFEDYRSEFEKLSFIKKNLNSKDLGKKSKADRFAESLFDGKFESISQIDQRSKQLGRRIKATISPVLIRRNRLDILLNPEYSKQIAELPIIQDPKEWFFELTEEQSAFYDEVLQKVFADPRSGGVFQGAVYQPQRFEKASAPGETPDNYEQIQQNLYDFMRRLLVKRFESSFGAFRDSLLNFRETFESAASFVASKKKFLINRDLMNKIQDSDAEEANLVLENYLSGLDDEEEGSRAKVYDFTDEALRSRFLSAINQDIETFSQLLESIESLGMVENDPKARTLVDEISRVRISDPSRKIVIFSEYKDTVRYFKLALEARFPNRVLSVTGELSPSTLRQIQSNFDASLPDSGEYDILIGTDKLSEGFNLNRAGLVINLDIPWNPVRVIQRVGRINRIGAMLFKELQIVNFFPSKTGANLVKSREIAAEKMYLIHSALGEDSKVFDAEEVPGPSGLYKKLNLNPDLLEEESFVTKLLHERTALMSQLNLDPVIRFTVPNRVKSAKTSARRSLGVLVRGEALHTALVQEVGDLSTTLEEVSFEELVPFIRANPETPATNWNTKWFWENYRELVGRVTGPKRATVVPNASNEMKALHKIERFIRTEDSHSETVQYLRLIRQEIISSGRIAAFTLRRLAASSSSAELVSRAQQAGILANSGEHEEFVEPEIVLAIGNLAVDNN
jgi:superfamily II DNA or RNA helicase